jgi:prepilin-type N-terminal cleavage/methylation domain-containing protein
MDALRRRKIGGFTLLEVLVALSILASSYGVILQIFGGAASKAALSGDYRRALIIAESQLAFAAANVAAGDVSNSGAGDEKFLWQVSYTPTDEYFLEGRPVRYSPVIVAVAVSWSDAAGKVRSISVSTVRLKKGHSG